MRFQDYSSYDTWRRELQNNITRLHLQQMRRESMLESSVEAAHNNIEILTKLIKGVK